MEVLQEVGVFLIQAAILVAALLIVIAGVVAISQRRRGASDEGCIEVRCINDRFTAYHDAIRSLTEHPEARKARRKIEKKEAKEEDKKAKQRAKGDADEPEKPRLFVINFDGDMRASQVNSLREEISAVLPEARAGDEVLVCLESPGGMVHGYGLAASQLQRIRDAGITLTVAVDKVAASGGYMMACVADRIVAAPFAIMGSIGVLAQLPNFHRLLKKNDIDFELLTAGEYKRTLTMFGENTEKGRAKFVEELEDTHSLFKEFVKKNREVVDIDKVSTGEIWYGQRALEVHLVDEICTSDAYIQSRLDTNDVLEVSFTPRRNWQEKLGFAAEGTIERLALKLWREGSSPRLP